MGGAERGSLRIARPRTPSRGADGPTPLGRGSAERLLTRTALDVFLHAFARLVIRDLARRRLHEIGRRRDDRAAEAPVEGELAAAYCVDDDAGAVRRGPDPEFHPRVQRDGAKR